ncbi:hypothetical protein GCM10025865_01320 [Paraoerskovia sediminicola]|uniref:Uncharacterized protein n=1 Tax=Paraoerskovia sediminicola TaxID=1138587 RepID=A0ABM8FYM1_9CELL|nr:hypothetical protein [Paraoerskovia sediminicola]BDZ40833.1 hypothetical protein GCM10025865_01320 [Paraoerskovia sediminicola]
MHSLRPLTVTTPTHALAVVAYWSQVILGLAYLTGLADALAMTELFGVRFTAVWAAWLLTSGLVCGVVVQATARERNPDRGLHVEFWAVLSLGAASTLYEATLIAGNGFGVLTTQVYATAIAVGAVMRARQISIERRHLHHALDVRARAAPSPLAEPPSTRG